MDSMKKLNVTVTARFASFLNEAAEHGKPASEVTEILAEALTAAREYRDEDAGELLRSILQESEVPFKAEEFLKLAQEPALAIHIGSPKTVSNCPFGRTHIGLDAGEVRTDVLAERTFAEWRVALKTVKTRQTVIIYKATLPVAIYRDVTWGRSPDEMPNKQSGRENMGRHFIASGEVTFFGPGKTFTIDTRPNSGGLIRPHLTNERPMDTNDAVLAYVGSHSRERKAVQQPLDLLDIG